MDSKHESWLDQTREAAIDPDLPIVDPHHHLWDFPTSRYLLDDILRDTSSGHRIVQTVFVECTAMYRQQGPLAMRPVGETEFVAGIAQAAEAGPPGAARVAAGIVGHADLTLGPDVAAVLEAHMAAADGRFRGIRHAASWDPSDAVGNAHTRPPAGLMADPAFRKGMALLKKYDLSFDAWLYHPQLGEFADLARAFPDTAMILDHMGSPVGIGPYAGRRTEVFDVWRQGIDQVAACDNVAVKLGGLAMKLCGFGWHKLPQPPTSDMLADAMRPYFEYCIERFGVERCMFESNFPMDKPSCAYHVLWNAFKRVAQSYSAQERTALFSATAMRVYGLEPLD